MRCCRTGFTLRSKPAVKLGVIQQYGESTLLVKYYGLVLDEESKELSPRSDFLSNGLFRMTQPKYLNNKGSEAKLLPYFNKFSPADLAWARKQHDKIQIDPTYKPTAEELINFHLRPE
jgi:hypothetical protein